MKKGSLYMILGLMMLAQRSLAQEVVSFSGKIATAEGKPVSSAVITLKNATGKKLAEITGKEGAYTFREVVPGIYNLSITHAEFNSFNKDSILIDATNNTLAAITLSPLAKTLSEVQVASTKPYISQTADKITLNVAASPVAAGSNAYDVLLGAPGVIEQNSNIQFRGRSVLVLIDGRQTNLSGDELKNFLSSMPANGIDKVEILPSPSARYDAQGGSVINIRLAKNKNFGTNGTVTAGVGAGKFGRYNAGLSLNHRNKNVNVYGSYDYQYNRQYYKNYSDRTVEPGFHILQNEYDVRERNNHSAKIGLDYDLNKRTSFGILAKGLLNYRDRNVDNQSVIDRAASADSFSNVHTAGNARFISPSVNVYWRSILDSADRELSFNADYFDYSKRWNDDFVTRYYDENGVMYADPYFLKDQSPSDNTVTSFSADFVSPGKKGRLEAGLKSTFTKTDNDVTWEYRDVTDWKMDHGKTNRFIYHENINAAYVNYSKQIKKYSLQLGLRAEQTNSRGRSITLGTETKRDYVNLFPNVAIQYAASPLQQFGFTYRKSIQRFGFEIVNPFIIYQSQYSYSQGNPNIKPMIMHSVGFSHTWKYQLFSSLTYTYIKDALSPVYREDLSSNSIISSFDNLNSANVINANITWARSIAKGKWISTNTAGGIYSKYKSNGDGLQLQNEKITYYYSSSNILRFKKGWSGELTGMYYSPMASGVYKQRSLFTVNAGLAKEVLKKKGNLKLSVRDIFNTLVVRSDVNYQDINTINRNKTESRFVNLVFTYRLGNLNVKANKNRKTGVEEERGRMGVE